MQIRGVENACIAPLIIFAPINTLPAEPQADASAAFEQRDADGNLTYVAVLLPSLKMVRPEPNAVAEQSCGSGNSRISRSSTLKKRLLACSASRLPARVSASPRQVMPISGISREAPVFQETPTFFDIVMDALETNLRDRACFLPRHKVMITGFAGGKPAQFVNAPDTIHLVFGRNTMHDPIELRIVVTGSSGPSMESPLRKFELSGREGCEKLLAGRILFDAMSFAAESLLDPNKNNQTLDLHTGRPNGYALRDKIAPLLDPAMRSEDLGTAIAPFCRVAPRVPLAETPVGSVPATLAQNIRDRLTEYFVSKSGVKWKDVKLIVTGSKA